jgi:hypothetical protein
MSVGMLRRSGGTTDAICTSADMAHLTFSSTVSATSRSGMCCSSSRGLRCWRRRGPRRHGCDVLDGVLADFLYDKPASPGAAHEPARCS